MGRERECLRVLFQVVNELPDKPGVAVVCEKDSTPGEDVVSVLLTSGTPTLAFVGIVTGDMEPMHVIPQGGMVQNGPGVSRTESVLVVDPPQVCASIRIHGADLLAIRLA